MDFSVEIQHSTFGEDMIVVADSLTVEPPSTFESNNDRMLDFNGENNRHFGPVMVAVVSPVESLETHSCDQNDRWHCQTVPMERIKMDEGSVKRFYCFLAYLLESEAMAAHRGVFPKSNARETKFSLFSVTLFQDLTQHRVNFLKINLDTTCFGYEFKKKIFRNFISEILIINYNLYINDFIHDYIEIF